MGYEGQKCEVDDALEGELEKEIEHDASRHDANDVATAQFEHLIELNEEPVLQLAVDQLDHKRSDQRSLKGEFPQNSEDRSAQKRLAKGEPSREEDEQDHPGADDVDWPGEHEVDRVLGHGPAIGRCERGMAD